MWPATKRCQILGRASPKNNKPRKKSYETSHLHHGHRIAGSPHIYPGAEFARRHSQIRGFPFTGVTDSAAARTDVYHIHFTKAATGKAAELAEWLKTPDPKAAMPGHSLLLRHQDGDA